MLVEDAPGGKEMFAKAGYVLPLWSSKGTCIADGMQ